MSFLRDMDLYKGIILVSVLLLPLGWWWVTGLDEEIRLSENAYRTATTRNGLLERIGQLQRKVEIIAQNRRMQSDVISEPVIYFDQQIRAVNASLGSNDFGAEQQNPAKSKLPTGQRVVDHIVDIDWGRSREAKEFTLEFVYAAIFNCESGAQRGGRVTGAPSVWRLRQLRLENATNTNEIKRGKVPAPELRDAWFIRRMSFARREPTQ